MLTLGQIQTSSVANIAGCNPTDPQFTQYVNEAVRQLMDIGNWWGTVQAIVGCVYDGCIVWPKKIDAVLGLAVCGRNVPLANQWYEFVPFNDQHRHWAEQWHCGHRPNLVEFIGTVPTFVPVTPANPIFVQLTCDNPIDYGKTVTIYGNDVNGKEITAVRSDGSTQRGVVLTLAATPPVTPTLLTSWYATTKDLTVGQVWAWSYVAGTGITGCIASYSGGDINPQFPYSRIRGFKTCQPVRISALVKLGYEAVVQASDIVPLDCLDAIKAMIQAIKKREAGADDEAAQFELQAIRRLNLQLRNHLPIEQFVVAFNPFGDASMNRVTGGFM